MKIARGLTPLPGGEYTCSARGLQRHFKTILGFVTKTDAAIIITLKGKNRFVLMSEKHYQRHEAELKQMQEKIAGIIAEIKNSASDAQE